jgi:polysaccharide export outer membrane protein
MKLPRVLPVILLIPFLFSCKAYRANIMFKTPISIVVDSIRQANKHADKNFVIKVNDYISIKVYTNRGERIIDPDFELMKSSGAGGSANQQNQDTRYLVRQNGYVYFPMIGDMKMSGYTLRQADSLLSAEYSKYYYDVFVITKILNNRIVVLGALGGKVIPIDNDNISVVEAIALYGGVSSDSRAHNIRLIRGDLNNPDVSVLDLSTIEGLRQATKNVEPNDIIYIEPIKRILPQTLQDVYPIVSIISSVLTLLVLFVTLSNSKK